MLEKVL